jgi:hypothetical protein
MAAARTSRQFLAMSPKYSQPVFVSLLSDRNIPVVPVFPVAGLVAAKAETTDQPPQEGKRLRASV